MVRQPDGNSAYGPGWRVTSHLSGILFRNVNFLEKGIRPVYVFDGPPPAFKSKTIEERRSARAEAGARWEEALAAGDIGEAYKQARSSSKIDQFIIDSSKNLLSFIGNSFYRSPERGRGTGNIPGNRGAMLHTSYIRTMITLVFEVPSLVP